MRHSTIATRATTLLGAVCALVMASCAPSAPPLPSPTVMPKPVQAASATPALDSARKASADADLEAARARDSLAKAKASLSDINSAWKATTAEADRLRKQKSASELELIALYNQMVEQEKRSNVLVSEMATTEAALLNEKNLRAEVTTKLGDAERLVIKKDAEADELRRLLEYSEGLSATYSKQAKLTQEACDKAQADAAMQKGKTRVMLYIILGMGSVILLAVGWWALKKQLVPWR